jgi:hypothetical protein
MSPHLFTARKLFFASWSDSSAIGIYYSFDENTVRRSSGGCDLEISVEFNPQCPRSAKLAPSQQIVKKIRSRISSGEDCVVFCE